MLHLTYESVDADLFSRTCVEQYDGRPTDAYGYMFAQVFEASVLNEIATLEGCSHSALERLEIGSGVRIERLRIDTSASSSKTPVQAVNIAAALISISRFKLAERVLSAIDRDKCNDRDLFEIAMLEFVINNRLANTNGMQKAFRQMRRVIETVRLPPNRVIDAATQAVVWHIKSAVIDKATFEWFFALGRCLVSDGVEAGSESSWYRAIAMIPASRGDMPSTRKLMLCARQAAEKTLNARPRVYELHFLKTYHESALKEHMYITSDKDAALAEADALIALDPYWSASYGEKAEIYQKFGDSEAAAICFERAGRCGPPYVGHHFFCAAQAWECLGAAEKALLIYEDLLSLDETNPSVVVAGLRLARKLCDRSCGRFEAAYDVISDKLGPQHRKYLHS
jgi:tetratricopeptide (TPR) repeat protein